MKKHLPDLFKEQPDLLRELVREHCLYVCDAVIKQLSWHMGVCFECLHAHHISLLVCFCVC